MLDIVAYTAICEEDGQWVDQYLAEVKRLGIRFAMHFDRCGNDIKTKVSTHRSCIGTTSESRLPFSEKSKQAVLDLVASSGTCWAMPWDMDETWDKDAVAGLAKLQRLNVDYIMLGWINLWGDSATVRTDGPFKSLREKMYNLRSGRYRYDSTVVNGPKLLTSRGFAKQDSICHRSWDVVCLHWGLMSEQLRQQHKARWDNVYSRICGKNPYGIWEYALDQVTYPPSLSPNTYI